MEMTWVGNDTNGLHQRVPKDVMQAAIQSAKEIREREEEEAMA